MGSFAAGWCSSPVSQRGQLLGNKATLGKQESGVLGSWDRPWDHREIRLLHSRTNATVLVRPQTRRVHIKIVQFYRSIVRRRKPPELVRGEGHTSCYPYASFSVGVMTLHKRTKHYPTRGATVPRCSRTALSGKTAAADAAGVGRVGTKATECWACAANEGGGAHRREGAGKAPTSCRTPNVVGHYRGQRDIQKLHNYLSASAFCARSKGGSQCTFRAWQIPWCLIISCVALFAISSNDNPDHRK
ncbi:uncharacterized protein P884DRAFT_70974 [Thermothelomyces heterothallicus CBS 202.75]|uniref:uncharacterized protein n=1 Tax=Thermothelomyces heterothallicus CBS 202.75 TaxID=1149848 RepID=UPI00374300F8